MRHTHRGTHTRARARARRERESERARDREGGRDREAERGGLEGSGMSRRAPAAWDVAADEKSAMPFKNMAARQARKVVSRVDCGESAASLRRKGLSENKSTGERSKPVGRTTALPTTTLPTKDIDVAMPEDGCTDYAEIARTIMPDLNDEWRMVLNTKITAAKWEHKKVVDQQVSLIGDLKKNIDIGRQQREVFLDRIAVMGQQLHSELSQLSNAKNACARSDALRESIATLETRFGSIEQEASTAIQQAAAIAAELAEKQAELKSKEDEVTENTTMLDEAKSAAATAQEDCEAERTQLSEQLEASVAATAKLKETMAELEAKISKCEKDTASAKAAHEEALQTHEASMEASGAEIKQLAEAATAAETEATTLQSLQESNEAVLASELSTLEECRATTAQHKSDADKTEEELAGQEKDVDRLRKEVTSLKQNQTRLTEEISALHAHKDQLYAQNHRVSERRNDLQEQCDLLSEEQKKLTELNSKLQANIADNQGKTKLAKGAAAESLQKYTVVSSAVSVLSRQLADKEAEQAAAKAEEATQTATRDHLLAEHEQLTKAHEDFVTKKPVLLEKIETQSAELAELRAKHGQKAKEQMEK